MKESLTESPRLLRGDGRNLTEDGLGASHRIKFRKDFNKAATGSPVIVEHCDGSVRNTDIVHKAASVKAL